MTDIVEIAASEPPADALWRPAAGTATKRFLDGTGLDATAKTSVRERASSVLGACLPPTSVGAGTRTGLVVGYVQSGKTQSFTALTALARDNGYPLVLLLAGTKKNLHRQTADRLREDLRKNGGASHWLLVESLSAGHAKFGHVENILRAATEGGDASSAPRTVVVTVMKNPSSLHKLTLAIRNLRASGALDGDTPTLIIDDEADQAGLNASRSAQPTATYSAIAGLRDAVGSHSYVMYTATPQAPLLLELSDMLSPDFVRALTPGDLYTGGEHFFGSAKDDFVRHIPSDEVAAIASGDLENLPTLERALAFFLLSVVAENPDSARSMLVHPSRTKGDHESVHRWIDSRLKGFASALRAGGQDREDAIDLAFRPAWDDLASTVGNLRVLDELIAEIPDLIQRELAIRTVNSETSGEGEIDWYEANAWILVGGFKLDRGFTIEGLTVTYMPRGIGIGNADSIQQRARFFGYKGAYSEYCRAWLEGKLENAYVAYVEHERHLLHELREVERAAVGLKQWKRRMLLDPALKPCRNSVVSLAHVRTALRGDGWIQLGAISVDDYDDNYATIASLPWANGERHLADTRPNVPDSSSHRSLIVDAHAAIAAVLSQWIARGVDAARLYQVAIVLANVADGPDDVAVEIVLMDGGATRKRAFIDDGYRVENLQVGRSAGYAGDRTVRTDNCLTLQFHQVEDSTSGEGPMLGMAMWVPAALASGILFEVDE